MTAVLSSPVRHRFVLEILHDNRRLHEAPLEKADFARAVETTFFEALRKGAFETYAPPFDLARIEPCFEGDGPSAPAFEVVLPTPAGKEFRQRFEGEFFRTLVRRTAAQLVLAGRVPLEGVLHYRLGAFADAPAAGARRGLKIDLEAEEIAIPITPGTRGIGPVEVWDAPALDDFPVRIPRHVLEESVAEARRTSDREVGGVLLGHLRRDETGELFLEVTCMVPGEETRATQLSVTFTHDTWARVREVAAWRGEGELIVGWVHSHPFRLCAECPDPVPPECQAKVLFYSTDDEFLMELTFPRPFMVGLLTAVEPKLEKTLGHLPVKLFGWKDGLVVPRGFEVIP
jgi:proteasome lid subunit RPN8/RPN11